jgi:hypothetical protein
MGYPQKRIPIQIKISGDGGAWVREIPKIEEGFIARTASDVKPYFDCVPRPPKGGGKTKNAGLRSE